MHGHNIYLRDSHQFAVCDRWQIVPVYPKIQAQQSRGIAPTAELSAPEESRFEEKHLAFMDVDALYFELQHFKNERAWFNLNLPRESILKLLRKTLKQLQAAAAEESEV